MKKHSLMSALLAVILAAVSAQALARNTVHFYSIEEALKSADNAENPVALNPEIALYFGNQAHPEVATSSGEVSTNKKTLAKEAGDEPNCKHVFLSAIIQLQQAAKQHGADAVVNIRSNYKNEVRSSATEYTCGAGLALAGVALKGELVKLKK
ncbi:excinuclease ABC subunit A [Caballeronia sp. LZ001]|uniref:excinuclease ABC subunit A n=1 Tax=Caballeronia sp. LZ001 TaxID=3038553 RepID=UPI0028643CF2|nr:excinuclease ABC subunit A [Caballeronia sp. LZ001]MDR5801402.1 excinuclease ABC subunit A [Caballeronia sp. LZ001]